MENFICMVCGYVYDPKVGDERGNIAPNTPFGELPEEWSCPVCGATKENFAKE